MSSKQRPEIVSSDRKPFFLQSFHHCFCQSWKKIPKHVTKLPQRHFLVLVFTKRTQYQSYWLEEHSAVWTEVKSCASWRPSASDSSLSASQRAVGKDTKSTNGQSLTTGLPATVNPFGNEIWISRVYPEIFQFYVVYNHSNLKSLSLVLATIYKVQTSRIPYP